MKQFRSCRPIAAALLLSAVPTWSCFSDKVSGNDNEQNAALCANANPNVVRIRNFTYDPPSLSVAPGTRVTWVNCDDVAHTVTSDNALFNSGMLGRHQAFSRTFNSAGVFGYFCEPHPVMIGMVEVGE
jgi:plastocyanin